MPAAARVTKKKKTASAAAAIQPAALEELLLSQDCPPAVWCHILVHLANDAKALARFSMTSRACQKQVFASLRQVLQEAAATLTAADVPVVPRQLLQLWWPEEEEDSAGSGDGDKNDNGNKENDNDSPVAVVKGNKAKAKAKTATKKKKAAIKKRKATEEALSSTQYDRLEGLGYYQAVVRAGLLQKRRVISSYQVVVQSGRSKRHEVVVCDRYHKEFVPHSALRMEKMLEILKEGRFCRSKALYAAAFPKWEAGGDSEEFQHDSVYGAKQKGGIVHCLTNYMRAQGIFPNFDLIDWNEHRNIHVGRYYAAKKYRDSPDRYEPYREAVPEALKRIAEASPEIFTGIWNNVPHSLRLLVAVENKTTVRW